MNKIFTQKKHAEATLKREESNFEPSQQSIQNILNYSKALVIKRSGRLSCFEIVLN